MSDTTIDEILGKAIVGDGFIRFSEQGKKTAQETKSALYDLIDKKIIGIDDYETGYKIDYGKYANNLRATQRNKLKQLFKEKE